MELIVTDFRARRHTKGGFSCIQGHGLPKKKTGSSLGVTSLAEVSAIVALLHTLEVF